MAMHSKWIGVWLIGIVTICGKISAMSAKNGDYALLLDSARYYISKDLDSAEFFVNNILDTDTYRSPIHFGANNLKAKIEFSRMHYRNAATLYQNTLVHSKNQFDLLEAEIGMMKICQRISDNVSYYKYRSGAVKTKKKIENELDNLSDDEYYRYEHLYRDFEIVSLLYLFELEQIEQASITYSELMADNSLRDDLSSYLMILYLRGLGAGMADRHSRESQIDRATMLDDCYRYALRNNDSRLQAMSLRAIVTLLLEDPEGSHILMDRLESINRYGISAHLLPLQLISQAMQIFASNGCYYDMIECRRLLATIYNRDGKYTLALENLSLALTLLNENRWSNYPSTKDDTLSLTLYREDYLNIENLWIETTPYAAVPETMSKIREQISLAYSGLGDKVKSDYNRDIYLELQKEIRIDKRYDARNTELRRSNVKLASALVLVLLVSVVVLVSVKRFNRRLKRRNELYINELMQIYSISTKIMEVWRDDVNIVDGLNREIMPQIARILSIGEITISTSEGLLPITMDNGSRVVAYYLLDEKRLTSDRIIWLNLISPFIASLLNNREEYIGQQEDCRELQAQYEYYKAITEDARRENIKRKTYSSVVAEALPLIERMRSEIVHLTNSVDFTDYNRRLNYASELLEQIVGYNNLLTTWIQMRRGVVSLNIESFQLQPLFDIVAQSSNSFQSKGVVLNILPTDSVVRADKSLTLFMINTLADNARKYTDRGGSVAIEAVEGDGYVEISVADSGVGMDETKMQQCMGDRTLHNPDNRDSGGFGLLNCRGIIEKYKNTDPLFSVCEFKAESRVGEGSRFWFRLPKGIRRVVTVVTMLFCFQYAGATLTDALLTRSYHYAEEAYQSNIEGNYSRAIECADSAIYYLNSDYTINTGDTLCILSLNSDRASQSDETVWLKQNYATDYETILWIRNEVAIAALALGDWEMYRYNNTLYLTLFKRYYGEWTIEDDSYKLQRNNSNLSILIAIIIAILLVWLLFRFVLYVKYLVGYRSDMQQILSIINKISKHTTISDVSAFNREDMLQRVVDNILPDMCQVLSVQRIVVEVNGLVGDNISCSAMAHSSIQTSTIEIPLQIRHRDESLSIGRMELDIVDSGSYHRRMIGLVSQYLSIALYNSVVRFETGIEQIEQLQINTELLKNEESRLHVNNMILDNALSTLKHETLYYPSRLHQLLDAQVMGNTIPDRDSRDEILELVEYYRNLYAALGHNVIAQAGDSSLKREEITIKSVVEILQTLLKRSGEVVLHYSDVADMALSADRGALIYLLELLIVRINRDAAIKSISLTDDFRFLRFSFFTTISDSQEQLDGMFSPLSNRDDISYVLCREIIKEHNDMFNHIGCRINAEMLPEGAVIWFTLPTSSKREYERV